VATSHTHARYLLPPVIERFIREFPKVALRLRQGFVSQIADWVNTGEADLSVSAAPSNAYPDVSFHPYRELHRVVLAPGNHPLLKLERPTLRDIAAWPIITYDREFAAHTQILRAFEAERLNPNIALSTSDTDVMKTYAMCGLGVAIVADSAFDPKLDKGLRAIDVRHLFPSTMVHIGVKRHSLLSVHALRFIELVSPKLRARVMQSTSRA
jgi:LysR family cys regulon transcriptional activator